MQLERSGGGGTLAKAGEDGESAALSGVLSTQASVGASASGFSAVIAAESPGQKSVRGKDGHGARRDGLPRMSRGSVALGGLRPRRVAGWEAAAARLRAGEALELGRVRLLGEEGKPTRMVAVLRARCVACS